MVGWFEQTKTCDEPATLICLRTIGLVPSTTFLGLVSAPGEGVRV